MSERTKPGTVKILKWEPKPEATIVRTTHLIPYPAKHAALLLMRLKLELLGSGCRCRGAEEIVGILKLLGCEVEIEGGTDAKPN
jgi:hypothetical protein